jgi:hypothetical protein
MWATYPPGGVYPSPPLALDVDVKLGHVTVGRLLISDGGAGNRTRLKNPIDLRKRRNRARETTPNDAR